MVPELQKERADDEEKCDFRELQERESQPTLSLS
jgi:hypothetical protein